MRYFLYVLLAFLVFGVIPTLILSYILFSVLLTRRKKDKWSREPSMPNDEEYVRLFEQAKQWRDANAAFRRDLEMTNDGLNQFAEYYDFGSDKAAIIIPGRMEACTYSCHYGEPYRRAGYNVLTIDVRSHGRSEGKVNTLGYKEYRDILAWARLLESECGIKTVVLHGVCIGASTALYAASADDCPDCIAGVVADGMYRCFYDSCKKHMQKDHRPIFPYLLEVMLYIRLTSGRSAVFDGPKKRIELMHRPILFIHSREDIFSVPEGTYEMFERCPSEHKQFAWFEHGGHSRVRINNPERYDEVISDYLASLPSRD